MLSISPCQCYNPLNFKEITVCYFSSISVSFKIIEDRFGVRFIQSESFQPAYSVCGFDFPRLPVISSLDSRHIDFFHWGLIPFWVKDTESAKAIREKTLNARAETLFEKPAFRNSIVSKRCLVIADGFFEWRHENKRTFPYYIRLKNREPFALAGLWDSWTNPETHLEVRGFSIITTEANSLLGKIHNTQKRMPVILTREDEKLWIQANLNKEAIQAMLKPYADGEMEAYPVSKLVRQAGFNTTRPEVTRKEEYPELAGIE
jgi:putative SOS response-associated peptidase YedK